MGRHRSLTTFTIFVDPPANEVGARYAKIDLGNDQLEDRRLVEAVLADLSRAIIIGMFGEDNGTH